MESFLNGENPIPSFKGYSYQFKGEWLNIINIGWYNRILTINSAMDTIY